MTLINVNRGGKVFGNDLQGEQVATSLLGTPVQSNISFKELSYENRDGEQVDLKDEGTEGDTYLRLDTVIFVVTNTKQIKRTRVPGRDGTVKEHISDGDYEVRIEAKLVEPEKNQRPSELMQKVEDIASAPVPIDIVSPFLNTLGVDTIVISDRRFEEQKGKPNEIALMMTAWSESAAEIDVNSDLPSSPQTVPSF